MDFDPNLPNSGYLLQEFQAFQRSLALRTALELEIFTLIGTGVVTVVGLAERCAGSERGIRILCDYLLVAGHLTKHSDTYGLTLNSSLYLSKESPAYIGSAAGFLAGDENIEAFTRLSEAIRNGGATDVATRAPAYWVHFAESMAGLALPVARTAAESIELDCERPLQILDVAAGHGIYGLALAAKNPNAHVFALDHPAVLEVAARNAERCRATERYHLIPGDIFTVDPGGPYDIIVIANLAHHFAMRTNVVLFRRCLAALAADGQLLLVDLVPDADRTSPAFDVAFALNMLATTTEGNTYTLDEFRRMLEEAGFRGVAQPDVGDLPHWVITARP